MVASLDRFVPDFGMGKSIKALFVLAAVTGWTFPAAASEYWYVAHDADRVLFVDQQSIRRDGPVAYFWSVMTIQDGPNSGAEVKSYKRVDCTTQEIAWLATAHSDHADSQSDIETSGRANAVMARPEAGTLDEAQVKFVCNAGYRVLNHLFPITIDKVAFARAVIKAGPRLTDLRALHETMTKDPHVSHVRSSAPVTGIFGREQTVPLGAPLVPPRDYHKDLKVLRPADYNADTVGVIYDVAYLGTKDSEIRFEVRDYSGNDMVHASSVQTESVPAGASAITIRDLAIMILKATPTAITYSVKIGKATPSEDCENEICGEASIPPTPAPRPIRRGRTQ
jgi:hypothetical protein